MGERNQWSTDNIWSAVTLPCSGNSDGGGDGVGGGGGGGSGVVGGGSISDPLLTDSSILVFIEKS